MKTRELIQAMPLLLRAKDVTRMTGWSRDTLYNLERRGKIGTVRHGSQRRYRKVEILEAAGLTDGELL